jgi:hypothetical protein
MFYCLLEYHTEEELWTCFEGQNWAAPFLSVFHSPQPTPETSETTLVPGRLSTRIIAQQFLSVNVSNHADQCEISWSATALK